MGKKKFLKECEQAWIDQEKTSKEAVKAAKTMEEKDAREQFKRFFGREPDSVDGDRVSIDDLVLCYRHGQRVVWFVEKTCPVCRGMFLPGLACVDMAEKWRSYQQTFDSCKKCREENREKEEPEKTPEQIVFELVREIVKAVNEK